MPSVVPSRRLKITLTVVAIVIVALVVLFKLAGVYANYLWFGELGHRQVYGTVFWTKVSLFFIFGTVLALIVGGNLVLAYRLRPPFRPMSPEQQNLQHYVVLIEPRRRLVLAALMSIVLLSTGAAAQGDWAKWQLFLHGGSFGQRDPLFHKDISFYAWDYPIYRTLVGFGFAAVLLSLLFALAVHYLSGAIRLQTPGPKVTISARRHITVLVFVFMLLKAVSYWLDRYGLVFSGRGGRFTGASYTDVHAELPARTILFWISIVLALAVLASMWLRSVLLPVIGFVLLIVISILIGGIYPAIVQHFTVQPNASDKEAPFIRDNIRATRQAYDIVSRKNGGTVSYSDYAGERNPPVSALSSPSATVSNIRILDPNVVSPTFSQQQAQQKNFYGFPPKLDVDRYSADGGISDYIVGVRELSAARLNPQQTNWINAHTVYTHGYGFVAAAADSDVTSPDGGYADGDIPQTGPLNDAVKLTQPEAYYGELGTNYVIAGATDRPREFNGKGGQKITYKGSGGIPLSSPLTKLAFAMKYKETNFLLNDAVSATGARVMFDRDPRQRIEKVAPFLKVDGDPYPIVDPQNGHIMWIVDGYTTMAQYPYSERRSLSSLTSNSLTRADRVGGQPNSDVNYIRNSVKATVDAYTGKVKLYDWDNKDPVLKAWMKIFPGLVQPASDLPATIKEHIRYPEDLFEVQRKLLEQYHVDNPTTFYNVGDKWTVPSDPSSDDSGDQPPYYVLASPPRDSGSATPQFQLTSPMKVNDRTNLAAYISVDSDAGPDYGRMTVLRLGTGSVIDGPQQVQNNFQTTPVVSSDRTLFSRGGSQAIFGNLLTLPLGNSFLYVEPFYVRATSSGFPILRRVLVQYGDRPIGYGASVQAALDDVRLGRSPGSSLDESGSGSPKGPSGTTTPTTGPATTPTPTSSPTTSPSTGSPPPSESAAAVLRRLDAAVADLNTAYDTHNPRTIADAQAKVIAIAQQYRRLAGSATPSK